MRGKSIVYLTILAFVGMGAALSRGEVRMLQPEYNFGVIREVDGPVTGEVAFVNDGPDSVYVQSVRPSCGCTGANYSEEPLAPGDTTSVSFIFNPERRPGNFTKTVKVYFGPEAERHVIRFSGRVVGSPQTLSRNYPIEAGPMRLSEKTIELRDVRPNTGRHAFVRLVNQSLDTVTPEWNYSGKELSIDVTPKQIAPGEIASLGIFLNVPAGTKTGVHEYVVPVFAAGGTDTVPVVIKAMVE